MTKKTTRKSSTHSPRRRALDPERTSAAEAPTRARTTQAAGKTTAAGKATTAGKAAAGKSTASGKAASKGGAASTAPAEATAARKAPAAPKAAARQTTSGTGITTSKAAMRPANASSQKGKTRVRTLRGGKSGRGRASRAPETMRKAKYAVGQVVKHRIYPFRGVIFDIDPVFNNTDEWWESIPEEIRPVKDQPFYHLLAENAETEYIAYVSEQNLLPDDNHEPLRHPKIGELFTEDENGRYQPIFLQAH